MTTAAEVLRAIRTIRDQTGFWPDAEELADALDTSTRSVHSSLLHAKASGHVRYVDDSDRIAIVGEGGDE